ncbi:MAG: hydroxymyristoyl-ACP dehydratase [Treponema sp.]|nr:hydroxymyristoyl-ACP dehydratase [Treponema sp.]
MTQGALAHGLLTETIISQSADSVVLQVKIPTSCDYFDGHFPAMKLLPAVAQIDIITLYAAEYFGIPRPIGSVKRFKFSDKIFPETEILVSISYNSEKKSVTFKISDAKTGVAYSSGTYFTM